MTMRFLCRLKATAPSHKIQWFDQIESNEVAKRVYDASVNMGKGTAVKLLQEAVGCPVDGLWGPKTIAAVNAEGDALVGAFKQVRSSHYVVIAQNNPEDEKYLDAWLARANA
jgi:lysozyme family protein